MPPIEKNPMDDLLKIPFSEVINNIIPTHVYIKVILENQIEILALLQNKQAEEVRIDVMNKLDKSFQETVENMTKTL